MKYQPFSVAISVYRSDNPVFFDRALESITVKQTIMPSEIVLVVDGPVPNEIDEIIHKYSLICVMKIIRLEKNHGLGNALKIATENSTYELIARMDSDDISVFNRFEQQLKCFYDNEDIDIVGGNITEFVGEESNIVATRSVPTSNDAIREYMKKRCAMNHVSVMFKKTAIMKAGGYLDWYFNEDYYLWIRMCLNGCCFFNTNTILVNVRTGKDMYARRGGLKYYRSEKKLQKFMWKKKFIGFPRYCINVFERFVIQILLPNRIRGFVFKKIARR
jgi:glycosyltransferase involved in cell wall biosynthesis